MPAASPDAADVGLTTAKINRARAVAMIGDFARFLAADRKLPDAAIGFGLLLVGLDRVRIAPSEHDLALCRSLAAALAEILEPSHGEHRIN